MHLFCDQWQNTQCCVPLNNLSRVESHYQLNVTAESAVIVEVCSVRANNLI